MNVGIGFINEEDTVVRVTNVSDAWIGFKAQYEISDEVVDIIKAIVRVKTGWTNFDCDAVRKAINETRLINIDYVEDYDIVILTDENINNFKFDEDVVDDNNILSKYNISSNEPVEVENTLFEEVVKPREWTINRDSTFSICKGDLTFRYNVEYWSKNYYNIKTTIWKNDKLLHQSVDNYPVDHVVVQNMINALSNDHEHDTFKTMVLKHDAIKLFKDRKVYEIDGENYLYIQKYERFINISYTKGLTTYEIESTDSYDGSRYTYDKYEYYDRSEVTNISTSPMWLTLENLVERTGINERSKIMEYSIDALSRSNFDVHWDECFDASENIDGAIITPLNINNENAEFSGFGAKIISINPDKDREKTTVSYEMYMKNESGSWSDNPLFIYTETFDIDDDDVSHTVLRNIKWPDLFRHTDYIQLIILKKNYNIIGHYISFCRNDKGSRVSLMYDIDNDAFIENGFDRFYDCDWFTVD